MFLIVNILILPREVNSKQKEGYSLKSPVKSTLQIHYLKHIFNVQDVSTDTFCAIIFSNVVFLMLNDLSRALICHYS